MQIEFASFKNKNYRFIYFIFLQGDLGEISSEVVKVIEVGKRAAAEAARLAEELRLAQDRSNGVDRQRKALEGSIKELQARIEEVEIAAMKGDQRVAGKLEQQLKNVEGELENEQRLSFFSFEKKWVPF